MEFTNFYSINWSGNLTTSFFFKIVEVNHYWDLEYKNSWFAFFFTVTLWRTVLNHQKYKCNKVRLGHRKLELTLYDDFLLTLKLLVRSHNKLNLHKNVNNILYLGSLMGIYQKWLSIGLGLKEIFVVNEKNSLFLIHQLVWISENDRTVIYLLVNNRYWCVHDVSMDINN